MDRAKTGYIHMWRLTWAFPAVLMLCLYAGTTVSAQTGDQAHFESDQRTLAELVAADDVDGIGELLRNLPQERGVPLARELLDHQTTIVAYMACGVLIQAGLGDETLPTLAEILASGRAATDLNNRMGYDWIHGGGEEGEAMFGKLADHLEAHRHEYEGEELSRVDAYWKGIKR